MTAILDQARQMPAGGVVVIGDSTAEFNRFDRLCGLPALNAGVAWSRSRDWFEDGPRVVAAARPSIVVLALGENETGDWIPDYRKLARATGARIGILPADKTLKAKLGETLTVADGAGSFRDGKHPDAKGAEQWRESVNAACRSLTVSAVAQ